MIAGLVRCSPRTSGFSQNNLYVCQNLIFMSSLIHKVGFRLANVFSSKMFGCHCQLKTGLTSLLNVHGCFSSFHNGVRKSRTVT